MDRTHKVQSQDKLEEHVKYLMQEAGLTSREADVARLICDGLSDKEIALRLGLSHHTVKDYLKGTSKNDSLRGILSLCSF